ncbi:hypothetical protein BDZ97DRAFT_1811107 [Flammula alnicola]|nr:hypothetical protein BDZ97DRAFT_1811107 [Flammula alnicola]
MVACELSLSFGYSCSCYYLHHMQNTQSHFINDKTQLCQYVCPAFTSCRLCFRIAPVVVLY